MTASPALIWSPSRPWRWTHPVNPSLWLLPPLQAVPLIMLLSNCNQLLSVGALRKELVLRSTPEREAAPTDIAGGPLHA